MHLHRIGSTALVTCLATIVSVDLGLPICARSLPLKEVKGSGRVVEGQLIQNPPSKIQKSWVLAQTPDARKVEADRLLQQGIEQFQASQLEAALQSWQQALVIYQQIKDRQGERAALGGLGNAYLFLNDYAKAIEYSQQSLAIARETQNRVGEAWVLMNLGLAYSDLGDYKRAIEYDQQSLAIARELNNRNGEAGALGSLGYAYQAIGDYAHALEYYQQSLAINRELRDRRNEGADLGNLGNIYRYLGDYAKAIEYRQQSLAIAREIKNRQGEGTALRELGVVYYYLGNYAKAVEYQQQSLAIAREIKDRQGEGTVLAFLGLDHLYLGDYIKAIQYEQQSLNLAREIKYPQGEGDALGNIGLAYFFLGDYPKAIEYEQQWLTLTRKINSRHAEGRALGNLGIAYYSLGNYPKAIEYQQQSLTIVREIKDRQGEGTVLGNLGIAYWKLGDYKRAIDYNEQRLAIAREIKDRQGEGQSLVNLSNAYSTLEDYAKAIDYAQQSLVIVRAIKDRQGEGIALNNLGNSLFKSNQLVAAEKTLFEGIQLWESLRAGLPSNDPNKVSIFEDQARTYRTLQKVLITENKSDEALEIAERGRARALVELLARQVSPNSTEQFTIPAPKIEQIKQIAKAQNSTIVQYSIIDDDFNVRGKEEAHDSELYIWVVKPTGEVILRKADLKSLWQQKNTSLLDLVVSSRQSMGVGDRSLVISFEPIADQTVHLKQLHKLLIEPIAQYLPTDPNEHVIFIPQEELFLVPFPALQDDEGKYLIQKHPILTAPSIQALQLTHEKRATVSGNGVLVVGNPTMPSVTTTVGEPSQQLKNLPGAEKEATDIAQLLNTKALTGKQATKAAVLPKLSNARIIHLATHGLLDDFKGLGVPGAIALAPNGTGELNDGLLTSNEIFELKLNAELVVLSACDTGRGRLTGDGVIGLSRSLITAGVPSIIVSLWSVPDAPTASLMTQFYQNLQKNPDKAQALRQAMLTTIERHRNPRDWAAFTLIGEAQ